MKCFLPALVCLLCVACATPQEQEFTSQRNTASLQLDALIASDGARLPVRAWLPKGEPKAVIIGLHGMNDYSNAFAMPGEYLSKQGIAVYAYDQRGFGASPKVGIWPGEENLISDLKDMVAVLKSRYPHVPVYVMGESMGGAVAVAAFARADAPPVDGVILSAPAVWGGEAMNPFYRGTLWLVSHIMPDKVFTGEGLKIMASDNIPMLRELGRDPLVQKGARADTLLGLVRLMGAGYDHMQALNVPLLVLYGKNDQVIPQPAVEGALSTLHNPALLAYYPSGYHMLLRDINREIPARDVAEWVLADKSALYSGLVWKREAAANETNDATSALGRGIAVKSIAK